MPVVAADDTSKPAASAAQSEDEEGPPDPLFFAGPRNPLAKKSGDAPNNASAGAPAAGATAPTASPPAGPNAAPSWNSVSPPARNSPGGANANRPPDPGTPPGVTANSAAADKHAEASKKTNSAASKSAAKTDSARASQMPALSPQTPKLAPEVPKMATPNPAASETAPPVAPSIKQTAAPPTDQNYPTVNKLEEMTFGQSEPDKPIQDRLSKLETAVYKKAFTSDTLFDRTERLKATLLGPEYEEDMRIPQDNRIPRITDDLQPATPPTGDNALAAYFQQLADLPENQSEVSREEQEKYAIELINQERNRSGMGFLTQEPLANEVAKKHVEDLCKRNVISHTDAKGENPDRRYTLAGGTGSLTENLVSLSLADAGVEKRTKAQIAKMLKSMMSRQDDREAVMAPEATDIGLATNWTEDKQRIICVMNVVCKHGIMHPIPSAVHVGEKIEVKGVLTQPYNFARITLAWEGERSMSAASDESKEALPYFPPLDYVAYQNHSEHDYSGAMTALKTVGVIAAIAGGMFMPPVALAAPLIAMSGSNAEPRPVSDIPVHGGVKCEGAVFSAKIPISNESKSGIYYITVWASLGKYSKPFPVSRRAILAKDVEEDVSAKTVGADKVDEEPTSDQANAPASK